MADIPAGGLLAPPPRQWRGVALILCAVFAFALSDLLLKLLANRLPVGFILALRYGLNLAILLAIFAPRRGRSLWRMRRWPLVMLRGLSLAGASLFFALAVRDMPLGETLAVVNLAPILVMLTAAPLLGERIGRKGWIAVGLGFLGVICVAHPGGAMTTAGVAAALACALSTAAYQTLSRMLTGDADTATLLVVTAAIGTVIYVSLAPGALPAAPPNLTDWLMLGGLGLVTTVGHFLFTAAYREAPASLLAPFNYVQLLWATLFGALVFNHLPDAPGAAGILMVLAAGVIAALPGRRSP